MLSEASLISKYTTIQKDLELLERFIIFGKTKVLSEKRIEGGGGCGGGKCLTSLRWRGPCSHNHVQDVLELQNIEVKVLLAGHIFGKL